MIVQSAEREPAWREIAALRRWEGEPREFWARLASLLSAMSGAVRGLIVLKDSRNNGGWKKIADHGQYAGPAHVLQAFLQQVEGLAETSRADGEPLLTSLGDLRLAGERPCALSVRFELQDPATLCAGVLLLVGVPADRAREVSERISLIRDVPRSYELFREGARARDDARQYVVALDLLAAMDGQPRFLASGLAWVNALADQFQCDRVSIGWLEHGSVRLRVMSRTEHFNRRMAVAGALEAVMEECLDQDEDIVFPAPADARWVRRDHERYAAEQRVAHLASLPLRCGDQAVAALTCERAGRPFELAEMRQLRLSADLVARRLAELRRWDRWFGARWATALREQAARWIGPQHTWAKLLALAVAALLAVLFLVPVPYRVEARFQLRSDEVAYLTAPYNGYIREVLVRPGDRAAKEAVLLRLDSEDLELEQTAALADLNRYRREAEKARASSALAEMRVAESLAEQAQARLDLVRYRLNHATLRAPFDSVVVEGDLRERIGAPVQQGDALFRVARLDRLYVEAEVDERDIQQLSGTDTGEIAFVSRPRARYPVRLERIEPAAVSRRSENVFLVRCVLTAPPEAWWRPGMTGVGKLNVGRRSILWIFTRRTVDFLRLWLWW